MSEQVSNFDKARELALNDIDVRSEIVEHQTRNGTARYEVRALSLEDQRVASRWATISREEQKDGKTVMIREEDPHTKGASMAIIGTFDPDSGKALFKKEDLSVFMKKRDHSLFVKLIAAASRVNKADDVEEAKKNSESSPTDDSSTN